MSSPCPNCLKMVKCGCNSCIERNGRDEFTSTFDEDTDSEICPFCGVSSHVDAWLDAEAKEIEERKEWMKLAEVVKKFNQTQSEIKI